MAINAMNIPTNVGPQSYSGLGAGWQNWNTNTVQPVLTNLLNNYQGIVGQGYDNAAAGIANFSTQQMQPAIQSTINNLSGRGMLNSSVASGTISDVISKLAGNAQGYQANLMGQKANAQAQMPGFASNLAQLGQYSSSSDNSTPYKIFASLLSGMM